MNSNTMLKVDHSMDMESYIPEKELMDAIDWSNYVDVLSWNFRKERMLRSYKNDPSKKSAYFRLLNEKRNYRMGYDNLIITKEKAGNDLSTYFKLKNEREKKIREVANKEHLVFNPSNPFYQFIDEFGEQQKRIYDPFVVELFLDKEKLEVIQKINDEFSLKIQFVFENPKVTTGKTTLDKIYQELCRRIVKNEDEIINVEILDSDNNIVGTINNVKLRSSMKKLVKFCNQAEKFNSDMVFEEE